MQSILKHQVLYFYFKDTIVFSFLYNVLCRIASLSFLNILNITLNINIVTCKWIYVIMTCFFVNINLSNNKKISWLFSFLIHNLHKKWITISNEMYGENGKWFCLWQAHSSFSLPNFLQSSILFSFWTLLKLTNLFKVIFLTSVCFAHLQHLYQYAVCFTWRT